MYSDSDEENSPGPSKGSRRGISEKPLTKNTTQTVPAPPTTLSSSDEEDSSDEGEEEPELTGADLFPPLEEDCQSCCAPFIRRRKGKEKKGKKDKKAKSKSNRRLRRIFSRGTSVVEAQKNSPAPGC